MLPESLRRSRPRSRAARRSSLALLAALLAAAPGMLVLACGGDDDDGTRPPTRRPLDPELIAQGKDIFRFDTFGDEAYWTDTLRMHEVIESAVTPAIALSVGLKVDADALPQGVKDAIAAGEVDLNDPATTLALLELDAVVGVKGTVATVDGTKRLARVGITCALCH